MTDWFGEARLGLFVHWDHASQQGLEVSWPLVGGVFALPQATQVSVEEYHSSAASFDPHEWDAGALARLARDAGAAYVVLTAKHHSGYAMFHSKLTEFSIEHSAFGRDIVAEFADAMRAEGLRVGIYYSLSDWHHPDYPAFTEEHKPYVFGASPPIPPDEQWGGYLDYMFGQIRELLTNYGRIDVMWFDGGWERPGHMWRGDELLAMMRSLQPEILVNDRLPGSGDYATPEQFVPPVAPSGRWETCMTMNESWGYVPADTRYKSARQLVHTLCEVAGKGGNLLLNVSPTGTGALPDEQLGRLAVLGEWMDHHGDAIIATAPALEPWQFYGPTTRRGDMVYLHALMRPYETVTVRGVPIRRVRDVRDLATGTALKYRTRSGIIESLLPDPDGEVTITVPEELIDDYATVIALDIAPKTNEGTTGAGGGGLLGRGWR